MTRKLPEQTTMPMLRRMVQLRTARLSYEAVAAVINLDFGTAIDGNSVRMRMARHVPADYERTRGVNGHFQLATPGSGQHFAATGIEAAGGRALAGRLVGR